MPHKKTQWLFLAGAERQPNCIQSPSPTPFPPVPSDNLISPLPNSLLLFPPKTSLEQNSLFRLDHDRMADQVP